MLLSATVDPFPFCFPCSRARTQPGPPESGEDEVRQQQSGKKHSCREASLVITFTRVVRLSLRSPKKRIGEILQLLQFLEHVFDWCIMSDIAILAVGRTSLGKK